MRKRGSFLVSLERAARMAAQAQREAEAAARRRTRDELRNQREAIRLQKVRASLQRERHFVSRQEEAQALTNDIGMQVDALRSVLGGVNARQRRAFSNRYGIRIRRLS